MTFHQLCRGMMNLLIQLAMILIPVALFFIILSFILFNAMELFSYVS